MDEREGFHSATGTRISSSSAAGRCARFDEHPQQDTSSTKNFIVNRPSGYPILSPTNPKETWLIIFIYKILLMFKYYTYPSFARKLPIWTVLYVLFTVKLDNN